ncbi:hypothetical protein D039_1269B, partial [Vibrio parahaemolyticus EKP-028]
TSQSRSIWNFLIFFLIILISRMNVEHP